MVKKFLLTPKKIKPAFQSAWCKKRLYGVVAVREKQNWIKDFQVFIE